MAADKVNLRLKQPELFSGMIVPKYSAITVVSCNFTPPLVSKSVVPQAVTNHILAKVGFKAGPPRTSLAQTEDFLFQEIGAGRSASQILKRYFSFDIPGQILERMREMEFEAVSLGFDVLEPDQGHVQRVIRDKLGMIRVAPPTIEKIREIKTNVGNSHGPSHTSMAASDVYISRQQALRFLFGYAEMVDHKAKTAENMQCLLNYCLAHELGHKIDDLLSWEFGNYNSVSKKAANIFKGWLNPEDELGPEELKVIHPRERFAEYWGQLIMEDKMDMKDTYNVLLVAHTNRLWQVVNKRNQAQPKNQLNLCDLLLKIKERLEENTIYLPVAGLLEGRRPAFFNLPPENYALPYPEWAIEKAIINRKIA